MGNIITSVMIKVKPEKSGLRVVATLTGIGPVANTKMQYVVMMMTSIAALSGFPYVT
jgi:hypothetical protein